MKLAKQTDVNKLIIFLKENIEQCVYIYIDITKYGVEHPEIKLWYSENNQGINSVIMKYYDSFQMFSLDVKQDIEKIGSVLKENPVKTISGNEALIKELEMHFSDKYDVNYGIVVRETRYKKIPGFEKVEPATIKDCEAIAHLMCEDEEFGENYDEDVLAKQLADRIETGMGRSFVMRENDEIVGHVATFAELDDLVVQSGLIVSNKAKNPFCGLILHEYMKGVSLENGKSVYAFRIKEEMKKYEKSPGTVICGHYGKLTKIGG